jgi:hypothetical protein
MAVSEDVNAGQTGESGPPVEAVEPTDGVDVEELLELMLETEIPMPEEAGYGHGV